MVKVAQIKILKLKTTTERLTLKKKINLFKSLIQFI